MKQYHSLAFPFKTSISEVTSRFETADVSFRLRIEIAKDLPELRNNPSYNANMAVVVEALIDDYEVSAIRLMFDTMVEVQNRPVHTFINWFRKTFAIFFQ